MLFLIKINIMESIEDDNKRSINVASAFIYLFQHQVWNTLKMILQNTRHKLYLLDVRTDRVDVDLRRTMKCRHGKKDTVSHPNCFFKLTIFISIFVESIQKDEFSENHRCRRHQKGCSTTWNFFLAANWDTVRRGVSNS